MADELLPCPFCGGDRLKHFGKEIQCQQCQALGPLPADGELTRQIVIDWWNRRPPPPSSHVSGWKPQRWMGPTQLARKRDDTHEEAMATIRKAAGVTTLSYEEVALCYARARGFIRDDAEMMCDPVKEASNG